MTFPRRLAAEGLATFFLFCTVVGSGIMGESLAAGNQAVALLANALATGAMLYVLITLFGPLSGAHMNPAVSLAMVLSGRMRAREATTYVMVQLACGTAGAMAAHAMFDLPLIQASLTARGGPGQWLAEALATFGLVLAVLGTLRQGPSAVGATVGLYITAAYWFTSSTSFANPAITLARSLTGTFSGIAWADVPAFVLAQLVGAVAGTLVARLLYARSPGLTSQAA